MSVGRARGSGPARPLRRRGSRPDRGPPRSSRLHNRYRARLPALAVAFEGDDHRHCKVCGRAIGPEQEFCSKVCRRKREEALRSRRQLTYVMYAAIVILVILVVTSYVHP